MATKLEASFPIVVIKNTDGTDRASVCGVCDLSHLSGIDLLLAREAIEKTKPWVVCYGQEESKQDSLP